MCCNSQSRRITENPSQLFNSWCICMRNVVTGGHRGRKSAQRENRSPHITPAMERTFTEYAAGVRLVPAEGLCDDDEVTPLCVGRHRNDHTSGHIDGRHSAASSTRDTARWGQARPAASTVGSSQAPTDRSRYTAHRRRASPRPRPHRRRRSGTPRHGHSTGKKRGRSVDMRGQARPRTTRAGCCHGRTSRGSGHTATSCRIRADVHWTGCHCDETSPSQYYYANATSSLAEEQPEAARSQPSSSADFHFPQKPTAAPIWLVALMGCRLSDKCSHASA